MPARLISILPYIWISVCQKWYFLLHYQYFCVSNGTVCCFGLWFQTVFSKIASKKEVTADGLVDSTEQPAADRRLIMTVHSVLATSSGFTFNGWLHLWALLLHTTLSHYTLCFVIVWSHWIMQPCSECVLLMLIVSFLAPQWSTSAKFLRSSRSRPWWQTCRGMASAHSLPTTAAATTRDRPNSAAPPHPKTERSSAWGCASSAGILPCQI